ncbi:hypothetical protein WUBG_13754, partial [Wuchereria bancrofti]
MNESFKKVERAIDDSQMTMDLVENEAARERLKSLRDWKDRRTNEINKLIKAESSLEENIKISQKLLDELGKALAEVDNREKSPELEELEHFAFSLEDRLQRALAQIQHTSLKKLPTNRSFIYAADFVSSAMRTLNSTIMQLAEPILTHINEEEANQLRDRLRRIGEQWKEYENLIREKRRRLDERFADESELNNEMDLLQF